MRSLPFEVDCPKCGARLVVSEEEWINRPVSCPDCGGVFLATVTSEPEMTSNPGLFSTIDGEESLSPTRVPPVIRTMAEEAKSMNIAENGPVRDGKTGWGEHSNDDDDHNREIIDGVDDDKDDSGDEDDEDGGSFDFWPFILTALGMIAVLLLVTIFVLIRSPRKVSVSEGGGISVEIPDSSESETTVESLPQGELTPSDTAEESPAEPEMDLSQAETEFFKPGGLPDEMGDGTLSSEPEDFGVSEEIAPATAESTDAAGVAEVTSDDVDALSEPSPEMVNSESAEAGTEASPTVSAVDGVPKTEATKTEATPAGEDGSVPAGTESAEDREEFEMFSGQQPDSFTEALPVIKGAEPINIPKRLALGGKRIQLPKKTLPQILEILSQFSGIPLSLDLDSFPATAMLERPVSIEMADWTVDKILIHLEKDFDLERVTNFDEIVLTLPQKEKEAKVKTVFDVTDIVTSPATGTPEAEENQIGSSGAAQGVSILPETLTPEILTRFLADFLRDDLVKATSDPDAVTKFLTYKAGETGTEIFLEAPARIVDEADSLLEQIRSLRRIPLKTEKTAEDLIPETLGWENLSRPCSLHFFQPVTLREALAVLEASQGIHFLFDRNAMKKAGAGLDSQVRLVADGLTLDLILSELLASLDLTDVILTENLFLVTSREEAAQKMTNEIYLWSDPERSISEEEFYRRMDQIRTEIDPSSWRGAEAVKDGLNHEDGQRGERDGDGENDGKGIIWFDSVSKSLLIRQNRPNQRGIRRFWAKTADISSDSAPSEPEPQPNGDGEEPDSAG